MRRLVWTKVTLPGSSAVAYQMQTADESWAEVSYISRTEIAGVAWAGADDARIREFYVPIEPRRPRRPTTLEEANEYLRDFVRHPAELEAEAAAGSYVGRADSGRSSATAV